MFVHYLKEHEKQAIIKRSVSQKDSRRQLVSSHKQSTNKPSQSTANPSHQPQQQQQQQQLELPFVYESRSVRKPAGGVSSTRRATNPTIQTEPNESHANAPEVRQRTTETTATTASNDGLIEALMKPEKKKRKKKNSKRADSGSIPLSQFQISPLALISPYSNNMPLVLNQSSRQGSPLSRRPISKRILTNQQQESMNSTGTTHSAVKAKGGETLRPIGRSFSIDCAHLLRNSDLQNRLVYSQQLQPISTRHSYLFGYSSNSSPMSTTSNSKPRVDSLSVSEVIEEKPQQQQLQQQQKQETSSSVEQKSKQINAAAPSVKPGVTKKVILKQIEIDRIYNNKISSYVTTKHPIPYLHKVRTKPATQQERSTSKKKDLEQSKPAEVTVTNQADQTIQQPRNEAEIKVAGPTETAAVNSK